MKFSTPLDMTGNELRNVLAHKVAGDPASPVVGQFWFDTSGGVWKWKTTVGIINPLDRGSHTGTQSADTITDGTTNKAYTGTEKTKLAGIATGATANSTDAALLDRANHTGTQSADTLTDGATNKAFTGTERTKLAGIATGATANDTDANLKNRANHTGAQTASTISDFTSSVRSNTLNQMAAPTTALDMNSQRVTNLADGVGANDAVTVSQLQNVQNATDWKDSVRGSTSANDSLSGLAARNGVTPVAGDRWLVKANTTGSQNGIYIAAAGAWSRAADATNGKLTSNTSVMVEEGSDAGTQWRISTSGTITVGTTSIAWTQFGAATTYTGGTGINVVGTVVNIDTTLVARIGSVTIGDGATTSYAVTHNLGTKDVLVSIRNLTDDTVEFADVTATSTTQVTVTFTTAPATNSKRITVHG